MMDNKDKKVSAKKGSKNLWPLQLAFLFAFLGGGGYFAYINMNDEAHKLAGGDAYADMSSSRVYNSKVSSKKRNFFFSREENVPEDNANTANKDSLASSSRLEKRDLGEASKGFGGITGENAGEGEIHGFSKGGKSSVDKQNLSAGLKKKLAMQKGRVFSSKGGGSKTSGNFVAASRGDVSLRENEGTTSKEGQSVAKKKTSVMESLKKTWKTGIYGARDASKDAAKGWIARTFDNSGPSRYSLEYDEKTKRALDRIDPNSIPNYLKDMDVNKSAAKTLGIKDVKSPDLDEDGTKKALDADKKYQAAKLANDASGGMLNSLFSGMDFGEGSPTNQDLGDYGDSDDGDDDSLDRNLPEPIDPDEPPDLFGDEQMDFNDGGGCGEECGCSCAAPCCCLPPDYFNNTGDFPDPDPEFMFA